MKLAHTTHIAAYTNDPGRGQNRRRPFHPTMTRAVGPQRRSSQLIARWHICALDEHRAMARPRRESFGHRSISTSAPCEWVDKRAYLHAANPTATGEVTLLSPVPRQIDSNAPGRWSLQTSR
jgi:hypothetical protein